MKRWIPLLITSVFLASCDDEPTKVASVPTAPAVASMSAEASGGVAAAAITGGSTICRVYVTERDVAKAALDAAPTDTLLQRRMTTLNALVTETCN